MGSESKEFDNKEYFVGGMPVFTTDSPFLVSSSSWLNDPLARDYVAKQALRKNHVDVPTTYDITECLPLVHPFYVQNMPRIEGLFIEERKKNPALDAWFEERFVSDMSLEKLSKHAKGSVGNLLYRYATLNGYKADFTEGQEIGNTHFEYFNKRLSQQHDLEHILGGFALHYLGESGVTFMRVGSYFQHLSPELAGLLNTTYTFLLGPLMMRTWLHYPETYNAFYDVMHQGMTVGRQSDPIFLMKYEPILDLSVEEAREQLGYRGVVDMDVRKEADVWGENTPVAIDPRLVEEVPEPAE
jgi:ubiquinone biosynthesis protein Coq4